METLSGLEHFEFRDAIVATGSTPRQIANLPIDGQFIVESKDLIFRNSIPEELTLIGGGYIGVELATVYAKLGTRVTLIEATQQLLPGFNKKISRQLENGLRSLGVGICLNHKALGVDDSELILESTDGELRLPTELIGVVAGRIPNTESVKIEEAGALLEKSGHVTVDPERRFGKHLFAIGDLTVGPALAHKATAEAEVAADVACGIPNSFDPTCIPMVVFSDPQIVTVGLDQEIHSSKDYPLHSSRFPLSASAKSKMLNDNLGYVNIVADQEGTVVGFQAVGKNVSELAGEASLAIESAAAVEDLAGTIHAHPTLGETIREASLGLVGRPLHISKN